MFFPKVGIAFGGKDGKLFRKTHDGVIMLPYPIVSGTSQ